METDESVAAAWQLEGEEEVTLAEEMVTNIDDASLQEGKTPKKAKSKWSKYGRKYSKAWEEEKELKGWVTAVVGDDSQASCRVCRCTLRAHHADLLQHSRTEKHKKNTVKFASVSRHGIAYW